MDHGFFITGYFQQSIEEEIFQVICGQISSPFEIRDGKIKDCFCCRVEKLVNF